MFPINIFDKKFTGYMDFTSSEIKKIKVPRGIDKNQYDVNRNSWMKEIESKLSEIARDNLLEISSKHYCVYCGSLTNNLVTAQLHNNSGYNLWMYTDWRCCSFICEDCCKNAGNPNVNYLKPLVDMKPNALNKLLSFEPDILIPSLEPVHIHFKFNVNFELIPLTARAQRTINKFSLNRKELINRRKMFVKEHENNYHHSNLDKWESPIDALFIGVWSDNTFTKNDKLHSEVIIIPEWYALYKKQRVNYPYDEQIFKTISYKELDDTTKSKSKIMREFPGLKCIKFSGIRGFENDIRINFEGKGCKIIIGENGVGKSTLLSLLKRSLTTKAKLSLDDLINDPMTSSYFEIEYNEYEKKFGFYDEKGKIGRRISCNIINISESRLSSKKLDNFISWVSDNADNKEFVNWIARKLKVLLNLPQDYYLVTNDGLFYWETKSSPTGRVYLKHLSSGYRSIIYIFQSILVKVFNRNDNIFDINTALSSTIVLIDEVELHLHPRFKKNIVENLKSTFPEVLFIMTTHDPLVIKSTYGHDEVIVLKKNNENTNVMSSIPSHQNFTTEQILTSPIFGLNTTSSDSKQKNIDAYMSALKDRNWILVEELRKNLTNVGFFGKTYRELIALSAVDAYLSDGISPTVEQIVAELILSEEYDA